MFGCLAPRRHPINDQNQHPINVRYPVFFNARSGWQIAYIQENGSFRSESLKWHSLLKKGIFKHIRPYCCALFMVSFMSKRLSQRDWWSFALFILNFIPISSSLLPDTQPFPFVLASPDLCLSLFSMASSGHTWDLKDKKDEHGPAALPALSFLLHSAFPCPGFPACYKMCRRLWLKLRVRSWLSL